jgi:hypothetical protein
MLPIMATSAAGGYATDLASSSPGTGYAKGMDQYMTGLDAAGFRYPTG